MYFLGFQAAIKAKQKYVSSDIASGESPSSGDRYSRGEILGQELSMEDNTSSGEDLSPDHYDEQVDGNVEDSHENSYGIARREFETRRWHKSCMRKASKLCTKACRRAFKTVCRKRKCKKRAKKALSRECKKTCTKNFELDDRESEVE